MKAAVALLVVVAALALAAKVQASSFYFTAEDLESDEALWELYGRWAAHHGVVREPGRFPAFKANAHILHGKQRHAGELMALNVFGDQTFDEFMATTSCLKPTLHRDLEEEVPYIDLELDPIAATRAAALPSKVDWRSVDAVTYVKNQGECGCCWAFATAGAVEGLQAIKSQAFALSLSAQFLLDCTYPYVDKTSDCSGGSRYAALALIKKHGGIPTNSLWPYKGYRSTCDTSQFYSSATISEYFKLKEFNATLLKLAVSLQPISVSIGMNDDIRFWDPKVRGNVYYGPFNTDNVTHGVLIVGYDVDDLGDPYWIVKNSWGMVWGDRGYININAAASDGIVGKSGVAGILTNAIFMK